MSLVIVGAGPNLGAAVARRFGREGMSVGLVARDEEKLSALRGELQAEGITAAFAAADIRDAAALQAAIASLAGELGPVEVLEYSPLPAKDFMKPILETTVDEVRGPLEFSVLGAIAAATAVLDPMLERGSGSILFTTGGAAINPYPLRAGVGISFAGAASPPAATTSPPTSPSCCGSDTPSRASSRFDWGWTEVVESRPPRSSHR